MANSSDTGWKFTQKELGLLQWQLDVYNGQWGPGPIPKLIPFKYWNRMWKVRVSSYPFMGWGLFALQPARAGDEFLPFVGRTYSKAEFKTMKALSPRFIRYVLRAETDVYQDGDGSTATWPVLSIAQ
jgi:hypothetical protein